MPYDVQFTPAADRQFRKLDRQMQVRIGPRIDALSENPRMPGVEKLQGEELYRLRVGDHRVIFEIHDKVLLVVVVTIGNRKDVYRR